MVKGEKTVAQLPAQYEVHPGQIEALKKSPLASFGARSTVSAAPLAGFIRDELGDNNMDYLLLAGLNLLGAVLFLIARNPKLPGLIVDTGVLVPDGLRDVVAFMN